VLTVAAATAIAAGVTPLELLALGLGGLAVVLAIGTALTARNDHPLPPADEPAAEPARR